MEPRFQILAETKMAPKKSAEATETSRDYEAMRAARKLTADENRWLSDLADVFKKPAGGEVNGRALENADTQLNKTKSGD